MWNTLNLSFYVIDCTGSLAPSDRKIEVFYVLTFRMHFFLNSTIDRRRERVNEMILCCPGFAWPLLSTRSHWMFVWKGKSHMDPRTGKL